MIDPMTPQRLREIAALFIDVKLHTVAEAVACADAAVELRAHADSIERNAAPAYFEVVKAAKELVDEYTHSHVMAERAHLWQALRSALSKLPEEGES